MEDRTVIHLSSKDKSNSSQTRNNFSIYLGQQFMNGSRASSIALHSYEVPNSFYNFDNNNKKLTLEFTYSYINQGQTFAASTNKFVYQLTPGNYSILAVLNGIRDTTNAFLKTCTAGNPDPNLRLWDPSHNLYNDNFDYNFDSATSKVTFVLKNAQFPNNIFTFSSFYFKILASESDGLASKLGFPANVNTVDYTKMSGDITATSAYIIDLRPVTTIYLRMTNIGYTSIQQNEQSNILCKIMNVVDFGRYNIYKAQDLNTDRYRLSNGLSSEVGFQLTDEDGTILDIQSDWSMTLVVFYN